MITFVNLKELKPGMVLAEHVYLKNNLLLAGGSVIKPNYINRLQKCGIDQFAVYDKVLEQQYILSNPVEKFYAKKYSTLAKIFSNLNNEEELDIGPIYKVIETILATVLKNQDDLLLLTGYSSTADIYLYAHSLDVCIYSLITAKAMKLSTEEYLLLGMGALLHDIGKFKVPDHILSKKESLTIDEFSEIKKHSAYGFYMLKRISQMNPTVSRIVLEHHERCDGSGYPKHLRNKEIHKLSKIIAIADIYDALTSDRVFKKKILPHEAAEYLLSISKSQLDSEITKIFLKNIAIYPKGCQVLLNTNEVAIVLDSNPKMPLRPRLKILTNNKGNFLQHPREFDMSSVLNVFITHVFS